MVALSLAPPKVARRAVRILVLTVRSATARRRASDTPLPGGQGLSRSPHAPERGATAIDRGEWIPIRHPRHAERHAPDRPDAAIGHVPKSADGPRDRAAPGVDQGRERRRCLLPMVLPRGEESDRCLGRDSPTSWSCPRTDMVPIRREEETSVVSHRTGRVESLR